MRMDHLSRRGVLAALLGAGAARMAAAAEPQFKDLVLSDDDDPDGPEDSFEAAATRELHLFADLVGVPAGMKVRCAWVQLAPVDKTLAAQEVVVAPRQEQVHFTLARPAAGWALGPHRVDLFLDGRRLASQPFTLR